MEAFIKLFLLAFVCGVGLAQDRVLYPIREEGTDVGVVILPGAYLQYYQYEAVAKDLQAASPYRLWVYLQDTPVLVPSLNLISRGRQGLENAGFPSAAPLVAIGHSFGAGLGFEELRFYPSRADAMMIWGSNRNVPMTTFPVPAMTLAGDLDGITTITDFTDQFRRLKDLGGEYIYNFPLLTLIGVNHGQFATGEMPPTVRQFDFPAEVSGEEARKGIADVTSTYINYIVKKKQGESTDDEKKTMDSWLATESAIMKPLLDAYDLDADPEGVYSPWTLEAQYIVGGVSPEDRAVVTVENGILNKDDLVSSRPDLELDAATGVVTAITWTTVTKTSTGQRYADMLEAKMSSQEAIDDIRDTGRPAQGIQCKDANQRAWDLAYNSASDAVRNRFLRNNVTVIFLDDVRQPTGPNWVLSSLRFDYEDLVVTIQGSSIKTFPILGGAHYCKLLSPARVAEFIYVDYLRQIHNS